MDIATTGTAPRPNTDAELAKVRRLIERRIPEGAERVQVLGMLLGEDSSAVCRTCDRRMRPTNMRAAFAPGTVQASSAIECTSCRKRRLTATAKAGA